ncbi:cysteine desulfurase NifS [Candidatus Soleaferrea massiliensis]|uniref:cysteine desulfurase NifS n=1 Tax=Candidatus Soleaferrea massiliensis TaxID=1470354 RepID=UPI00058C4103|nr:cysteine desulfurase NifS [Candidatus Soleaferrea massiliensis]
MKRFVYADNAATTKISDAVLDSMLPYLKEHYGNPSSIYSIGRDAKIAVENARKQVAEALGCEPREIFFTSGGSEADNWAIKGAAYAQKAKGKTHIITTNFEHHAVLHAVQALEKEGFDVTYLSVDEKGLISPSQVADAIRDDTALVTIMYANNEIGTILPIAEIGKICREKKVLFHTDAVQAVGHVAIDVKEQNIDLLSLSAHKLHGPKGVGALYCRKGVVIRNLIDGGAQERGKRASTENVAGIVGLATAITESTEHLEENAKKMAAMRDRLIGHILKIDRTRLNGDREKRLPGNANFSFEGVEGESLLLMLDLSGVCASSGSACTSGSLDPSHVLLAIGLPHEVAHGSLRLSVSEYNTDEDIEYICSIIDGIIERLRAMSPLWERIVKEGKES